jgi:hypothetical protein
MSCTLKEDYFPAWMRSGRESHHPPPYSAEVKSAWSYNSTPQYVFMAWCLVQQRYRFERRTSRSRRFVSKERAVADSEWWIGKEDVIGGACSTMEVNKKCIHFQKRSRGKLLEADGRIILEWIMPWLRMRGFIIHSLVRFHGVVLS